ncbi:MAG: hypothetical protein ABSF90_08975 [Syntrophobacteraceae bacterium]|jgi:hypothetical protein
MPLSDEDFQALMQCGPPMLAGEIEARDVAACVNMSQEERAKTAPSSSENIKPEDAIVRPSAERSRPKT